MREVSRDFVSYRRSGHRKVQGWVNPQILRVVEEIDRCQRQAGVSGGAAEIGVHHGRFFLALHLLRTQSERSLAIDLFEAQEQNVDLSGKGDEAVFRRNLVRHAGGDADVVVLSGDSTRLTSDDVLDRVGPVRIFSVDGGHTAPIVLHDMTTAAGSITPGGIVIADDVFNDQWPGVADGTYEFLEQDRSVVPFAIGFNKVLFSTPDHADRYRVILSGLARRRLWDYKQSVMHGHDVTVMWVPTLRRRPRLLAKRILRK